MKKHKSIKRFMFGSAQYNVSDGNGSNIVLRIDYEHGTYALEDKDKIPNGPFRQEVASIALDLIKRKHGVNFAEQVR